MRHRTPARPLARPLPPPPLPLEAIRTARVYEGVVGQIQRLVTQGDLRPGDKLPSERELCRMFQVGRSSVRDAIRVLHTMGMVRSRHGGGTVVQDLSPESIVAPLATMLTRKRALVEELMDVRCVVEPALAARAAVNASPEDVARLRAIVREQAACLRRGELSTAQDAEFHAIIARASGNRVMLTVLDILLDLLSETRTRALQGRSRLVQSMTAHRRILRALERRSPESAEKAMREHILGIQVIIARKLAATQSRQPRRRADRAAPRRTRSGETRTRSRARD